jgi:hypothetical protein
MEPLDSLSEQIPPAIRPIYLTEEPNQPIQLYQGSLEITQGETVVTGTGSILFEWFPSLDVKFELSNPNHFFFIFNLDKASLKLLDLTTPVSTGAFIYKKSDSFISGTLDNPFILDSKERLSSLLFHLTNFRDFQGNGVSTALSNKRHFWHGRVVLEAESWSVTIDTLESFRDIKESLKSQGGYAVTHVGKLEGSTQGTFTAEEADDFLTALYFFFSFSRGLRTPPILPIGYNISEEKVWEKWTCNYITSSWIHVESWFPHLQAQSLNKAFSGFLHRWKNPTWQEPIKLGIHWYLESNSQAGGIQGSIVLEQIAFELLSWVLVVEEKHLLSPGGFGKLPAADQLRLLLSQSGVPLELPTSLINLIQASKELNWVDGPEAFTGIRNAITHSGDQKKRQKILHPSFFSAIVEAYELGLWYLELVFLHLFEYRGDYFNRVAKKQRYQDNIEAVPWS